MNNRHVIETAACFFFMQVIKLFTGFQPNSMQTENIWNDSHSESMRSSTDQHEIVE